MDIIKRKEIKRPYLFGEFITLFYLTPGMLYFFRYQLSFKIVPLVLIAATGCLFYLIKDKNFNSKVLWRTQNIFVHLKKILMTFILPALLISVFTYFFHKAYFLAFPKSRPILWFIVMLLYPLLAAYPQELIFRGFFFHRYNSLFPNKTVMIVLNGLSFGLAHLVYANWIAVILSTLGGILFAYRYLKCNSILTVGIEHGLWGDFLFTIGLGWYFYSGSI